MKLLIVDDEPYIRQGIRTTIPWENYGIRIVGEASNGKSALKLALQLMPDIIIADISMPGMSGLELAAQIGEYLPEVKIIILTAFGTTDNFIGAFESNVTRFVLKNADAAVILDNVLQVKAEIEKSKQLGASYEQLNNIYNENHHLIKSTLFSRFLHNQLSAKDFLEKAEKVGLFLSGPCYSMLLAKCRPENDWLTTNAFQNSFRLYTPFVFFAEENMILIVLNTEKGGLAQEALQHIFPEIKPYIAGNQLACLNKVNSVQEFSISYNCLKTRLSDCFWHSEWEYSVITQQYIFPSRNTDTLLKDEKEIMSAILCENTLQMNQALHNYFIHCKENSIPQSDFFDSIKRLLLLFAATQSVEIDVNLFVSSICDLETPEEMVQALTNLLNSPSSLYALKPQIASALNYINENYSKDLRLEDVAQNIYLSAGYLSRIFKSETGYSFKEWVHRVRIEKARELIAHTELKYYEIAEKVGYRDYKYFSAYFNKICGCSAKEYRNRNYKPPTQD